MQYVTLIPGLLCAVVLWWRGTRSALLNVVLPTLLLLPASFYMEVTHLPRLAFIDVTLFVFGIGLLIKDGLNWQFSRMDLFVALFILSCGYAEWTHFGAWRAGALALLEGFVPYAAAKLLLRDRATELEVIKRITILTALAFAFGSFEFLFKHNPYSWFWSHFYPGQWGGGTTQLRWGFGRTAGPYTQSEFAGIMVMTALLLGLWLARWYSSRRPRALLTGPTLWFAGLLAGGLVISLYITQARGPWIGAVLALVVASIGRALKPARRTVIILSITLAVALPLYFGVKQYTSGPRTDYGSEKETAQYRAELIDNYIPMAEHGGAWGLGRMIPIVHGQSSIDNEFLFVWLVQGYVGLVSLLLLLMECIATFFRAGLSPTERLRSFVVKLPADVDTRKPLTGMMPRFRRELERATHFALELREEPDPRGLGSSPVHDTFWIAEPTAAAQREQLLELRDRELYFTVVGILLGFVFTITTVWLGAQTFELLFLFAGWSQAVRLRAPAQMPQFQFTAHPLNRSHVARIFT